MASKYAVLGLLDMLVIMMLLMSASADFAKDREECADQLVGLATCLPYVGGEGKSPTLDCCTGLKQVLQKGRKCLCILIKDRNDPNLGLKINATIAMGLPSACHAPANISACPALLQLPAGSPDAKIFEEYGNSTAASKSTSVASAKANSTSSGSSAEMKSDGGRRRWVGVELVFGLLFLIVSHLLLSSL
ncbi:protein YLS3-like [Vitis riparia]|uniref:protein YLS3-like n=1 Tax=Vitis riparia TaxID=96939 RepID=UPI00155B3378|nr:protein YLS3-like [Vitis riparia]